MGQVSDLPTEILEFPDRKSWAKWLDRYFAQSDGVWVRLAKRAHQGELLAYEEAIEEALCVGWIDALKKGESSTTWLQRFTPRKPKSIWSKINCAKATALIESGRMKPGGLKEVERAKADGRWDQAYDGARTAEVPEDLKAALAKNKMAKAFFENLDKANRYAILWRLQTAKRPETRAARLERFVAMLARGEKIHNR